MGNELTTIAEIESSNSYSKWVGRAEGIVLDKQRKKKVPNTLYGVPNSWVELINTQFKKCPLCTDKYTLASSWHLKYKHSIMIPNVMSIWRKEILPITTDEKMKRVEICMKLGPIIDNCLTTIKSLLNRSPIREEL